MKKTVIVILKIAGIIALLVLSFVVFIAVAGSAAVAKDALGYVALFAFAIIDTSLYSNCIYIESYREPWLCEDTITVKRYYLPDRHPQAVINIGVRDSISFEFLADMRDTDFYRRQDNDTIKVLNLHPAERRGVISYALSNRFKVLERVYANPGDLNHNTKDENDKTEPLIPYFDFSVNIDDCKIYYPDPNNPRKQLSKKARLISRHRIKVKNR